MTIDNIFNSIGDTFEFLIDTVVFGLVRTVYNNKFLLVAFMISMLIGITGFVVYQFFNSVDDFENSVLIASEKSVKLNSIYKRRAELKNQRAIEIEEQRKVNEGRRKSEQFKRNIDKYGLSYLNDGKKFADAYFFKYPERYSFHYAGKTYYNDKLLNIYKEHKEYIENQN